MALRPQDIDRLYRDEARRLLAFFARRTWDPETAVDLVAETFAEAVRDRRSFRGRTDEERVGWLYGIARHQLASWHRRGEVERRARRRLRIERRELTEVEYERIVEHAGLDEERARVAAELVLLTGEAREALRLRVVEERSYADVAAALGVSEPTARARVSRALRTLAQRLQATEVVAGE